MSRIFKDGLRRSLHRIADTILTLRSAAYPHLDRASALVIAPHPDDEALGCAGVILRKRSAGIPVHVVYLTDGSAGLPGHPLLDPIRLASQRRREAVEAMRILGLDRADLFFLCGEDGALDRLSAPASDALVNEIAELVHQLGPPEVFVPCRSDGSSEHDAAFSLIAKAIGRSGLQPRILEYPIWARWSPRLALSLLFGRHRIWRAGFEGPQRELKRSALAAYVSQVKPVAPWTEAALSADFVSLFSSGDEFFFET